MNRKTITSLSICLLTSCAMQAAFSSGSDGSDGALLLDDPGNTIVFDPDALGLDADGDGIFHFTTVTITNNTTVTCSAREVDAPMIWLATGDVLINGPLDLSGSPGRSYSLIASNGDAAPSVPGPGGFAGGNPGVFLDGTSFMIPGGGPGGGITDESGNSSGANSDYMSPFGIPLVGGSGGGGGGPIDNTGIHSGGGGGAGGGAILIASDTAIRVTYPGKILANGGIGGYGYWYGGSGGSGGLIRLVAPEVYSNGTLSVAGGARGGSRETYARGTAGTEGVVRIEAITRNVTSPVGATTYGSPYNAFVPDREAHPWPQIRITEVGGQVIENPQASFEIPDATIDTNSPVDIVISAKGVPTGTEVTLYIFPENAGMSSHTASLTGSEASGSATFNLTLPAGFTRGFATADWSN
jgi:hypothetical protein